MASVEASTHYFWLIRGVNTARLGPGFRHGPVPAAITICVATSAGSVRIWIEDTGCIVRGLYGTLLTCRKQLTQ